MGSTAVVRDGPSSPPAIWRPLTYSNRAWSAEPCRRTTSPQWRRACPSPWTEGPAGRLPGGGCEGSALIDGTYHPVDSSEMAFKTAASQAFKKGFMEASPVLLEPIVSLKVIVPDSYTGDVMGHRNKRRGRVLGMTPVAGGQAGRGS